MSDRNRAEKFETIAERRVNEAIRRIRLIGNLSNKSNYSYTDEHARQIVKALEIEIRELRERFTGNGLKKSSFKFQLRSTTNNDRGDN
jgi:hypothetical protein